MGYITLVVVRNIVEVVVLQRVSKGHNILRYFVNKLSHRHFTLITSHLINNPRMFNLGIDDLAEKPYIPQKKLFL